MGNESDESKDVFPGKAAANISLGKSLKTLLTKMEAILIGGVLTYEEVMKFFIAHKNDAEGIVKGVMMRESVEGTYLALTQVLLDKDNNIVCGKTGKPVGRRIKTLGLDAELLDAFKNENMVVVD